MVLILAYWGQNCLLVPSSGHPSGKNRAFVSDIERKQMRELAFYGCFLMRNVRWEVRVETEMWLARAFGVVKCLTMKLRPKVLTNEFLIWEFNLCSQYWWMRIHYFCLMAIYYSQVAWKRFLSSFGLKNFINNWC